MIILSLIHIRACTHTHTHRKRKHRFVNVYCHINTIRKLHPQFNLIITLYYILSLSHTRVYIHKKREHFYTNDLYICTYLYAHYSTAVFSRGLYLLMSLRGRKRERSISRFFVSCVLFSFIQIDKIIPLAYFKFNMMI